MEDPMEDPISPQDALIDREQVQIQRVREEMQELQDDMARDEQPRAPTHWLVVVLIIVLGFTGGTVTALSLLS